MIHTFAAQLRRMADVILSSYVSRARARPFDVRARARDGKFVPRLPIFTVSGEISRAREYAWVYRENKTKKKDEHGDFARRSI